MNIEDRWAHFLLWESATRDTIDFKKIYVDMAGNDLVAGLLLSQIVFWNLPNREGHNKLRVFRDGYYWLAKQREDWWKEVRITPRQFDRAIAILEAIGLVITKVMRFGGDPIKHIRLVESRFIQLWEKHLFAAESEVGFYTLCKNEIDESVKTKLPKGENGIYTLCKNEIDESVKSLTETTPEITPTDYTETTTTGVGDGGGNGQCGPEGEQVVVVVSKEIVEHIVQVLVDNGCPRRKAKIDVQAALESGFYPSWVELNILRWFAYTRSPQGRGIKTPATFVLSKVKSGDPCPDDFEVTSAYSEFQRVCELGAAWIGEQKADQPDDRQIVAASDESSTLADDSDALDHLPVRHESASLSLPGCAMTTDKVWASVLDTLRQQTTWAVYSTWLASTWVIDIQGDSFFIGVHSPDALKWFECHEGLHVTIERTLTSVIGLEHRFKVRLQTLEETVCGLAAQSITVYATHSQIREAE